MSKYKLEHIGCNMWRCTEEETGATAEFLEAQFSSPDYYKVPLSREYNPETDGEDEGKFIYEQSLRESAIMQKMGEWLKENHRYIAYTNDCDARCTAIYKLGGQYQWWILYNAFKQFVIRSTFEDINESLYGNGSKRPFLDKIVNEYNDLIVKGKVKDDVPDWQRFNLLGSIALLFENEAQEVLNMVAAVLDPAAIPANDWANDLYRWPYQYQSSWLPF